MPHASCPEDVPGDVCCDTFSLIGERIRTVALAGVTACMDPDCGDREFRSWSTVGDIIDPLGESLVVSFINAALRQDARRGNASVNPVFVTRVEFRVELRENGWPTHEVDYQTGSVMAADWEMQAALTPHALGHAEKMWRSVVGAAATTDQTKALFVQETNPHIIQRGVVVEPLTRLQPFGTQIGFGFTIRVDTSLR